MINKNLSQKGSAHVVIVVILVVALLGVLGFVFWQNFINKSSSTDIDSTQNQPKTSNTNNKPETPKPFSLLDGEVKFKNDETWKTTTGGYYSQASGKCGQGVDSSSVCLDHLMLIPSSDTFTNPDQFQVNISVFNNSSLSPQEWLKRNADPGGENAKTSTAKINGLDSYRYEVRYGSNEIRLSYAMKIGGNIVLVSSTLFNGDYYSYKNDKDYRHMISNIDELVESINR